jgi:hypothetical protein
VPVKWGFGYDHVADIVEAATILKLISRSWAFYTVGTQKIQGKEKLIQELEKDQKLVKSLEDQIQGKIKEMRMWKKVLDDDALEAVTAEMEAEDDDISVDALVDMVD